MNRRMPALALLATLVLTACAQSPDSIQPQYVSAVPYESWTCAQLGREQQHLATALTSASATQDQARTNDTAGVLLLGLPVASMSGENIAPQIALIKGKQEAVHEAVVHDACKT